MKNIFGKWSLLVLLAGVADAQNAANWTRQIPQDFPPPTFTHSMAYDSARVQPPTQLRRLTLQIAT